MSDSFDLIRLEEGRGYLREWDLECDDALRVPQRLEHKKRLGSSRQIGVCSSEGGRLASRPPLNASHLQDWW